MFSNMNTKKQYYYQTFRDTYSAEFPCILNSDKGERFGFCKICRCDINISHGGKSDISVHIKSAKHLSNVKCQEDNHKLSRFFVKSGGADLDITRAECLFTSFLIEHNIPLAAADHAGALVKKMFPDSEIAKKYGCGRTKTSAIMKEMASDAKSGVVQYLKSGPFSVATDGSNDTSFKLYPIVVTFYDEAQYKIVNVVLSIPVLEGDCTGRNIGNLVLSQFECNGIPIEHCIAFCSDNAAVMIGHKNGVAAVLKEKHPGLIEIGCVCHLINLAAEKAASSLPVKVDDILVDIFYYLEKSSKKKETLHKFQDLHDTEAKKILKHVCSRWLSLGRSLLRVFEQWQPLLSFFKAEVLNQKQSVCLTSYKIPKLQQSSCASSSGAHQGLDKETEKKRKPSSVSFTSHKKVASPSAKNDVPILKNESPFMNREEKLFMFLSSDLNKALCAFLLSVVPSFEKLNVILQSSSPHIHILRELLFNFLRELISNFVKPRNVNSCSLLELDYHSVQNQKDDVDLVIGCQASRIAQTLDEKEKQLFFAAIRNYFVTACDYIVNKFPIRNAVLKNAEVARMKNIQDSSFSSVHYFVDLLPIILPVQEGESRDAAMDKVTKQFSALQIDDISGIVDMEESEDVKWAKLAKICGVDGILKYDKICRIMLSILSIPHSNAECERIFSLVKKNRTQFRSSMSSDTLESLSILKTRKSNLCYEQNFSSEFLKRAKKATIASLKPQCSSAPN